MRIILGLLCALLFDAAPAIGQTGGPESVPDVQATSTSPAVDPAKLPVSLERVRRELAMPAPRINFFALKLEETVNVEAVAPPLMLFNDERAKPFTGSVPYGAPTHRDFIERNTPKEYRTPAMDISAFIQWLLEQLGEKPR